MDGMQTYFCAAALAATTYIAVSLLGKRTVFNMDRLLHRGKYATEDTKRVEGSKSTSLLSKLGMTDEFTKWDRRIYITTLLWHVLWFAFFLIVTLYSAVFGLSDEFWLGFWHFYIWMLFIVVVVVVLWLGTGGVFDVIKMFKRLATMERTDADDGWVVGHVSTGEQLVASEKKEADSE